MKIKIGLIGNYNPAITAHQAIPQALKLSAEKMNCQIDSIWLETELIAKKYFAELDSFHGLWAIPDYLNLNISQLDLPTIKSIPLQAKLNSQPLAEENKNPYLRRFLYVQRCTGCFR